MKNNKLLLALSLLALFTGAIALLVSFMLLKIQDRLVEKIDVLSGQLVQVATITETPKDQWTEEVKPGINQFSSDVFGNFDYPSEWGVPISKKMSFANGSWGGNKWTVNFNGGGLSFLPWMEAYRHDPSINIYYPFDTQLNPKDPAILASAAFAGDTSVKEACTAYKKLHNINNDCQNYSEAVLFIEDEKSSEKIWFVTSPLLTDPSQRSPGFLIHSIEENEAGMKQLLESLKAPGTWEVDEEKVKEVE